MQLTEHFSTEEFGHSTLATRNGIDNKLPLKYIYSAQTLCEQVLEPLRKHIGRPIIISSGYRCPALNMLVGGVKNSQHMVGEAADFTCDNMKKLQNWFDYIKHNLDFDQLIKERATKNSQQWWIHVSCKPDLRKNRHAVFELVKNN